MTKRTLGIIIGIIACGLLAFIIIATKPASVAGPVADTTKTFTTAEVAKHATRSDCWTIISGQVYDVTDYVESHPGGSEILRACGTDATSLFNTRRTESGESVGSGTPHSSTARSTLGSFQIGTLEK